MATYRQKVALLRNLKPKSSSITTKETQFVFEGQMIQFAARMLASNGIENRIEKKYSDDILIATVPTPIVKIPTIKADPTYQAMKKLFLGDEEHNPSTGFLPLNDLIDMYTVPETSFAGPKSNLDSVSGYSCTETDRIMLYDMGWDCKVFTKENGHPAVQILANDDIFWNAVESLRGMLDEPHPRNPWTFEAIQQAGLGSQYKSIRDVETPAELLRWMKQSQATVDKNGEPTIYPGKNGHPPEYRKDRKSLKFSDGSEIKVKYAKHTLEFTPPSANKWLSQLCSLYGNDVFDRPELAGVIDFDRSDAVEEQQEEAKILLNLTLNSNDKKRVLKILNETNIQFEEKSSQ